MNRTVKWVAWLTSVGGRPAKAHAFTGENTKLVKRSGALCSATWNPGDPLLPDEPRGRCQRCVKKVEDRE